MSLATRPEKRAVFLDRDGVLVVDRGPESRGAGLALLPGAAEATKHLREAGFFLVVVSNQPVVARGLCTEAEVRAVHEELSRQLTSVGGGVDEFRFCPHHPEATLADYRIDCECRKPRPGMLVQAAERHAINLEKSYMVGDRLSDIQAGEAAGCQTAWVQTGRHLDAPIVSRERAASVSPDFTGANLAEATAWILR